MTPPERRVELILRLPDLQPQHADKLAEHALAPLARRLGGSLSRIERDHYPDHQMHVERRRIA